jgi:effector-binding domain-containing protein
MDEMDSMVPIGRFAKMTGLSVKALRHYDATGVLRPAWVDVASGYRYYRLSQANHAEAIRVLRSLDMPLEEIRIVLNGDINVAKKQLRLHRERLEGRLAEHRRRLEFLQRLLERDGVVPYEVRLKQLPDQQVAAVRTRTGLAGIGEAIGGGIRRVLGHLGAAGVTPAGPPLVVYHDEIDEHTDGEVEICVPVLGSLTSGNGVHHAVLPGGLVASTTHRGPYDEIRPAYHTLAGWVQEHGHELAGPPREIYLDDPTAVPAEELRTEVNWPIR